jgi:hypothetical protein
MRGRRRKKGRRRRKERKSVRKRLGKRCEEWRIIRDVKSGVQ